MIEDTIKLGEKYDIGITLKDADDNTVDISDGWSVAATFSKGRVGGDVFFDTGDFFISNGTASFPIDTSSSEWKAGVYFYDVRITDDGGANYFTDPIKLTIQVTNTDPA